MRPVRWIFNLDFQSWLHVRLTWAALKNPNIQIQPYKVSKSFSWGWGEAVALIDVFRKFLWVSLMCSQGWESQLWGQLMLAAQQKSQPWASSQTLDASLPSWPLYACLSCDLFPISCHICPSRQLEMDWLSPVIMAWPLTPVTLSRAFPWSC